MRVGGVSVGGGRGGARGGLSLDGGWERWVRRRRRNVVFVEARRVSRQDVKWSWMDERMVCVVGVERNGRFEDRHGEWSWWGTFVVEEGWRGCVCLTVVLSDCLGFMISWVRVYEIDLQKSPFLARATA